MCSMQVQVSDAFCSSLHIVNLLSLFTFYPFLTQESSVSVSGG